MKNEGTENPPPWLAGWRAAKANFLPGSVVPLAMLANVARIAITVSLVGAYGAEFAQGALHESFGLATFIGGTCALLLVARVVR